MLPLWEILKKYIGAFWYVQGGSENSQSKKMQLTINCVHVRSIAYQSRNLLAVSKLLSDIACQSNSTTLMIENSLADIMSQLKVEIRNLPIANPVLSKEHQKRKQPPQMNLTSSASRRTVRVHKQRKKQTKIENNTAMTFHHV